MKYHLCTCGAVVVEERAQDDSGLLQSTFYDLDGVVIDRCPGCGAGLQERFGPDDEERARENALPAWLYEARRSADEDMYK